MTKDQLKALHVSRGKLEKLSGGTCDRAWYDLVLINIGRVPTGGEITSKALTQIGFERVMAFIESHLSDLDPKTSSYWRDIDRRRGHFLTTRQEWEIKRLFAELQTAGLPYQLGGLVRNACDGRVLELDKLNMNEARKLIEAMKAILARQESTATASEPPSLD